MWQSSNLLGIRVTKRSESYLLIGAFSTLLAFGLWALWQVRAGFIPEAPPEFLEIERHLRIFAWALVGFAALGSGVALAIHRDRRWGYRALAWLLTLTAIGSATIRVIMPPRVVVDPDWPLILGLSVVAAVYWRRSLGSQTDA